MTDHSCDVAIIGAGTAGLAAERAARRDGATTRLIDDRFAGTTCTTVGCMPSKLLIAAAHAAHAVRQAPVFGIGTQPPAIDGPAVMDRVHRERDAFIAATCKSIEQIPDGIRLTGRARFVDRNTLMLDSGDRVQAKAIVIATGSRPHVPEMFETLGDRVLTNESVFDLHDLPRSLAVIGAGPLGLELAQAFARLGVDTEVFDQGEHLAGLRDKDVASGLTSILQKEFPIRLGVELSVRRDGDAAAISWSGPSSGRKTFERVLVATGRPPQLGGLDLAKTVLALDKHGTPKLDTDTMQCGDAPIFMAGDADAQRPVLHEASIEGAIAGRNAANYPNVRPGKRPVRFAIMFTDPPMAVIGEPPGDNSLVGKASYADQGRAKVEARNAGLVRLYADRADGKLTGATLAGPAMDHIAHLLAWSIERGETASTLLTLPFYHPTFEEGLKTALREICKATGASADHDDPGPPGT